MRTPPTWMKMSNGQHKHDTLTWGTMSRTRTCLIRRAWAGLAFGSHEHGVGVSSPNCTMHRLGRP